MKHSARGLLRIGSALLTSAALFFTACDQTSGSGSSTESEVSSADASLTESAIRGCVPACSIGFRDPGSIGPGPYTTTVFLDGHLTVSFPSRWVSHEDAGVEFSSGPPGREGRVLFWLDILPWDQDRGASGTALGTSEAWLDWLRSNPMVSVTSPRRAAIGQMRLPARYVDVITSPTGPEKFPELITWPNAGPNVYGIGGSWIFRLYLADVTYGGQDHVLSVAVEGTDAADLRSFLPKAERLIASANAPIAAAE